MNTEKLVRVTMLFKKNPDLTDAEFHQHWAHTHAPLCTEWMKKYGIIKYTQNHIAGDLVDGLRTAVSWAQTAPYNGIADFYVRDLKHFTDAVADEYYMRVLVPDGAVFGDMATGVLTVGEDYMVVDNNQIIQDHERDYYIS
ncbi:hypothetical protein H072_3757 [Dactylellina haptotyla CBS 200.50]|uniref:EthD domain-containing protein n=1 Tax=Dactylellina haptotyla (strain CBS 200.50) TaxID=1284197 RepID=S8C3K9_DACHA|nr:hypothetical protein H072_3757 [Dactylellina haptotyla CBS 200.50]